VPKNAAIPLVENVGGLFMGEESIVSGREVALDLPLGRRRVPGKFGCTGCYGTQMHKEQTDKHSSLYAACL
jgi:hypothetical protein